MCNIKGLAHKPELSRIIAKVAGIARQHQRNGANP
jgi:hypothetical protein